MLSLAFEVEDSARRVFRQAKRIHHYSPAYHRGYHGSASYEQRALRKLETGTVLDIHIKRERKDQTLAVEVPEQRVGFNIRFHEPHETPQPD